MQKETALIGLKAMTGGTIRLQVPFVILDVIFHFGTGAVTLPVEHLGAAVQVGDDKARVALVRDFD